MSGITPSLKFCRNFAGAALPCRVCTGASRCPFVIASGYFSLQNFAPKVFATFRRNPRYPDARGRGRRHPRHGGVGWRRGRGSRPAGDRRCSSPHAVMADNLPGDGLSSREKRKTWSVGSTRTRITRSGGKLCQCCSHRNGELTFPRRFGVRGYAENLPKKGSREPQKPDVIEWAHRPRLNRVAHFAAPWLRAVPLCCPGFERGDLKANARGR